MALRRFGVGQGALAWLVAGSLVMASACSSDSNVDFDPTTPGGGDSGSGGTKPSSSGSGSGAAQSGGSSNGTAGDGDGGTGNSAGSEATAGKNSGGQSQGGKASNGGTTSNGGKAGSANGGSTNNGGSAGSAGSAGTGGNAGSAGSGGSAGAGGGGGNSDCVAATFGGHSYYFCGVVDSAPAAYAKCQDLGMKMVEIETLAEHSFVIGKQKGQSWLGGTDELKESEWRWASTTQVFWDGGPRVDFGGNDGRVNGVYSNFIVGQPNDTNVDGFHENCLAINANGWNDLYCNLGGVRAACEGAGPIVLPNQ